MEVDDIEFDRTAEALGASDGEYDVLVGGFLEDGQPDISTYKFRFEAFIKEQYLAKVKGNIYRKSFLKKCGIEYPKGGYADELIFNFCLYANEPRYFFAKEVTKSQDDDTSNGEEIKNDKEAWTDLAVEFEKYLREKGDHPEYLDLCAYTVGFGIYEDCRRVLLSGGTRRDVIAVLKEYRKDERAMRYVRWLAAGRFIRKLNYRKYRTVVPMMARFLESKRYGVLSLMIMAYSV